MLAGTASPDQPTVTVAGDFGDVSGAGGTLALDAGALALGVGPLGGGPPGVGPPSVGPLGVGPLDVGGAEDAGERAWHPATSSSAAATAANGLWRPIPAA
jgi:hypothetical protein